MTTKQSQGHTAGPWSVGGHPRDDSGTAWREILAPSEFGPMYIGQAVEENARLLAALEGIIEWASDSGPLLGKGPMDIAAYARAAIARARGE